MLDMEQLCIRPYKVFQQLWCKLQDHLFNTQKVVENKIFSKQVYLFSEENNWPIFSCSMENDKSQGTSLYRCFDNFCANDKYF